VHFQNFHSFWYFIKETALRIIEKYEKDNSQKSYEIEISEEESELYHRDYCHTLPMLQYALEEVGLKNKGASLADNKLRIKV